MRFGNNGLMVRRSRQSPAVTGVSLSQSSATLNQGDTLTLAITLIPSTAAAQTIVWSSSNTAVATVDQAGLVAAVASGSATITVTVDGTYTATCAVTVQSATQYYYTASDSTLTGVNGNYELQSGTHGTTSAVYTNGTQYLYYYDGYWIFNSTPSSYGNFYRTGTIVGTYGTMMSMETPPTVTEY